jgi:hypothetical protein
MRRRFASAPSAGAPRKTASFPADVRRLRSISDTVLIVLYQTAWHLRYGWRHLRRFIPACAGNAWAIIEKETTSPVHPRLRGERA